MPRNVLQSILRILAKGILRKYRPTIVAVTGSVGKTSSKEAIAVVLQKHFSVRKSEKNLNTAIGAALAVIGGKDAKGSIFLWLENILTGLDLILRRKSYPQVLVIELGADRPGDIRWFAEWLKPRVAVVTAVGEIPVHVEFYSGPEEVAREKAAILKGLAEEDFAILNFDDLAVYQMKEKTKAKVITFGFGEGADIKISEYHLRESEAGDRKIPGGIGFKLEYGGSFIPVRLKNCFGKPNAYAAAAAAGVGVSLGLNLVEIADALFDYRPPSSRLELKPGVKETWIMDDTYNASPASTRAALETLRDFPGERKIAVLGDMRELGKFSFEAHQTMGYLAKDVCDYLFTVGTHGKIIGEAALEKGFPKENHFHFDTVELVGKAVELLLKPGDLVLVKGSRALKMEEVVKEIEAYPGIG